MASLLAQRTASFAARAVLRRCQPLAPPRARIAGAIISQKRLFSQSFQSLQRRYTESHEWIEVASSGKSCKIGITTYAAESLGDVVYVELPAVGDETVQGEAFGSVESVKSASDIVSPVSGTVVATNEPIAETPADLGKDPEGDGWLIEVESPELAEVESLMDKDAYAAFTADH